MKKLHTYNGWILLKKLYEPDYPYMMNIPKEHNITQIYGHGNTGKQNQPFIFPLPRCSDPSQQSFKESDSPWLLLSLTI
jgi:hypothetical protein